MLQQNGGDLSPASLPTAPAPTSRRCRKRYTHQSLNTAGAVAPAGFWQAWVLPCYLTVFSPFVSEAISKHIQGQ